jgi:drug/metabolite transporter (DMT)-like permease
MNALAIIGFAFMIVAMLLFVAGAPTIGLMPRNIANFSGIAAAAVGVLVWVTYGLTRRQEETDEKDESQP